LHYQHENIMRTVKYYEMRIQSSSIGVDANYAFKSMLWLFLE